MRRYEFMGLERFARMLGRIVGLMMAMSVIPTLVLVASRGTLDAETAGMLMGAAALGLGLAVWVRMWLSVEDSGVYILEGNLVVKLGRLFERTIPLALIAGAEHARHAWWQGIGVRVVYGRWVAVVTSTKGVVSVRFKQPLRIRVLPLIAPTVPELRLSLAEPEWFIEALGAELRRAS